MTRRLKLSLTIVVTLAVLSGVFLWALPEIVRRVAVAQIPKLTGRGASIEDVDLNLFTGRLALKKFRLAEREPSESFIRFDRLDLRVSLLALFGGHIRLRDLALTTPTVRIVRTGPAEFNFSDLLALIPPTDPSKPPSRWTMSLDRLALVGGAIVVSDRAVSPAREWQIQGLGFEAGGLTTVPGQPPGRLLVNARVNEAALDLRAEGIRLTPASLSSQVAFDRFDLSQIRPYLPPGLPAVLERGELGFALKVSVERGAEGFKTLLVSGQIQIDGLALAQPDRPAPFLNLSRLIVDIKEADLLSRAVTLAGVEVDGLDLRAVRGRTGEIDLLAASGERRAQEVSATTVREDPAPASAASASTPPAKARLERLSVRSGTVTLTDEAVSPAREWRLAGLTVDGAGFSTAPGDAPGTLKVRAQILAGPGSRAPATLAVDADSVRLTPAAGSARLSLDGFDLADLGAYWPETLPAIPRGGSVGVTVNMAAETGAAGLTRATASGNVKLTNAAIIQRGAATPFFVLPKLMVDIKQADVLARTIALARVELEGMRVRAVRDAGGKIDLMGLTAAAPVPVSPASGPATSSPPAPSVTPTAAAPAWKISLDRFALTKAAGTFEDRAISPATTLSLTDLAVTAERLTWPATTQATFTVSASMPGSGRTEVKGTATLEPLNVQLAMSTRDATIDPYRAYFPFPAHLTGLFSGDSLNEIQRGPNGELIVASRGTAWATDLEVRAPDGGDPVVKVDAFEIRGIDFSWPNYALIDHVTLTHPQVRVERDAQGQINLRTLFAVQKDTTADDGAKAPPSTEGVADKPRPPTTDGGGETAGSAEGGGLLQTMVLDFAEIEIADGFARFIDRTTTPEFSQDMSRLALKIRDLSNILGRPKRTTLTVQALVGVDGALDMRGDLSGIGETLRADLVAELRDYSLPSANPYADSLTSWVIQQGKLQAKIHYHIEGDRITAEHDLGLKKLRVEKSRESDEAKRRIGIPLGLAVALLKDSDGDIDFTFPLTGTLSDRSFDWGEAMWAGVKQVIVKVLLSPFNALGRLLKGGDDTVDKLEVDPVTFAPGSAVIAPSLEAQLTRVADFLRRSPHIKLALAPVVIALDVESLKVREARAHLEAFRREERLPDLAAALPAYYRLRLPDTALPKTVEEQIALLARREIVPAGLLAELAQHRLEAVRNDLVTVRGIPATRLVTPTAPPATGPAPATSGEGRVEFTIVSADQ